MTGEGLRDQSESKATQSSGKSLRILVVDDNEDVAVSLAMLLELQGHEADSVSDGFAALEKAKSRQYDVVFLDIDMPIMNGIETARRLRELPHGTQILLVALTGWGQDKDREGTREAGFHRHLVKPVDPGELVSILRAATK